MTPYEIRKNAGMTQAEMAKFMGVTIRTISRWETGKAKPTHAMKKILDGMEPKEAGEPARPGIQQPNTEKSKNSGEQIIGITNEFDQSNPWD